MDVSSLTFKLDVFEGPLDLLMHLITKNRVSIDDIPIALILDQYLSYLETMQSMNIEVTSDFIVMAAQLILIKSRMVLPRPEAPETEDPRRELVQRLEEYKTIKLAASWLQKRADHLGELLTKEAEPLPGRPTYQRRHTEDDLRNALARMLAAQNGQEQPLPPIFSELVGRENETIEDAARRVVALVRDLRRISVTDILAQTGNRHAAIAAFLALLELCRDSVIYVDDANCASLVPTDGETKTETE